MADDLQPTRFSTLPGFDPEETCRFTGLDLHQLHMDGRMAYWREDGFLCRMRDLTKEEQKYLKKNPEEVAARLKKFRKWLKNLTKQTS